MANPLRQSVANGSQLLQRPLPFPVAGFALASCSGQAAARVCAPRLQPCLFLLLPASVCGKSTSASAESAHSAGSLVGVKILSLSTSTSFEFAFVFLFLFLLLVPNLISIPGSASARAHPFPYARHLANSGRLLRAPQKFASAPSNVVPRFCQRHFSIDLVLGPR